MFKRVMVGVIGIPLLVLVLSFAPAWATMLLMMALCGVGAHELLHAVGAAGDRTLCVLTEGSAALVPLAVFGESFYSVMPLSLEGEIQAAGFPWGLPILGLALVLGLFLHAILRYGKEGAVPFAHLTAGIFGGLVFPLMLSCLLRLRMGDHGQEPAGDQALAGRPPQTHAGSAAQAPDGSEPPAAPRRKARLFNLHNQCGRERGPSPFCR